MLKTCLSGAWSEAGGSQSDLLGCTNGHRWIPWNVRHADITLAVAEAVFPIFLILIGNGLGVSQAIARRIGLGGRDGAPSLNNGGPIPIHVLPSVRGQAGAWAEVLQ